MERCSTKRTPAIGIIADDLTGAGDTGVQFTAKGLEVSVLFQAEGAEPASEGIVIDTDSRTRPREQARARVCKAARWLKDADTQTVYKKVDSTLRGNVGIEIQAAVEELGVDFAVIAPAYPKMGRTTVGGIHYVNGVPLHETEISRDPKTPVTESDLCRLLEQQTGEKTAHLQPRKLGDDWKQTLAGYKREGIRWLVFDAETDDDLARIIHKINDSAYSILWVGSAGLAEHLFDAPTDGERGELPATRGPVMIVSGSMSNVTRQQVERVLREPGAVGVELDPSLLLEPDPQTAAGWKSRMNRALEQGRDVVVYVSAGETKARETLRQAKDKGWSRVDAGDRIARSLSRLAAEVIQQNHVQRLVLTGGDTAKAVCTQLGVQGMTLRGEVEPGLPMGELLGDPMRMAVTKAGAFGSEESLVHAIQQLKGTKAHV